jgi:hypothetical protein
MTLVDFFKYIDNFKLSDLFLGEDGELEKQKELFMQFLIARATSNESLGNSIEFYMKHKREKRHKNLNKMLKKMDRDLSNGMSSSLVLFRYKFITEQEKILIDQDDFNQALMLLQEFRDNQFESITKILVSNFLNEAKYLIIFLLALFFANDILLEHIEFNREGLRQLSDAVIETPIYVENKYFLFGIMGAFLGGAYAVLKFFHYLYKEETSYIYSLPFGLNFKYYEDYLMIFNLLRLFERSGRSDIEVVEYLSRAGINSVITKQFKKGMKILDEGGYINECFDKKSTPELIKDKIDNGILTDKRELYYDYIIQDMKEIIKSLKENVKVKSKLFFGILVYGMMLVLVVHFYTNVQLPMMDFTQMK